MCWYFSCFDHWQFSFDACFKSFLATKRMKTLTMFFFPKFLCFCDGREICTNYRAHFIEKLKLILKTRLVISVGIVINTPLVSSSNQNWKEKQWSMNINIYDPYEFSFRHKFRQNLSVKWQVFQISVDKFITDRKFVHYELIWHGFFLLFCLYCCWHNCKSFKSNYFLIKF